MPTPNLRSAARVVALSPTERVLLVRFELKTGTFWATPGGGVEGGESRREAAARELVEETGIAGIDLVGPIWDRTHYFPLHGFDGQNEQYFLARTVDEAIDPQFSETELRAEGVTALRWWTLEEIATADAVFAPRNLGSLLASLVRDGVPDEPVVLPDQHAEKYPDE